MALQEQESDDEENPKPKRKKNKNESVIASSDGDDQGSVSGKDTREGNEREGTEEIEEIERLSTVRQRRMCVLYTLDRLLMSANCSQTSASLEGQGSTTRRTWRRPQCRYGRSRRAGRSIGWARRT